MAKTTEKTAMDKKIDELNAKLGKKTGIDFKGSAKAIGSELYSNKPYLAGVSTAGALFVLTTTGFFASILLGAGAGFVYSKYTNRNTSEQVK